LLEVEVAGNEVVLRTRGAVEVGAGEADVDGSWAVVEPVEAGLPAFVVAAPKPGGPVRASVAGRKVIEVTASVEVSVPGKLACGPPAMVVQVAC
jgi:hypothetical protein